MAKAKKTATKKVTPQLKTEPVKKQEVIKNMPPPQTSIPATEAVSEGKVAVFDEFIIKEIMVQKGITREEAIAYLSDQK